MRKKQIKKMKGGRGGEAGEEKKGRRRGGVKIRVAIRVNRSCSCRVNVRIVSTFANPIPTRIINVSTFANPNPTHLLFVLGGSTRI